MPEFTKTMKLPIYPDEDVIRMFVELTERYASVCNFVSQYVFDHGCITNYLKLQKPLYHRVRDEFGLKSQFTISAFKTVTARYKTIKEQMAQNPYRYKDENGDWVYIPRTLEWLTKPVCFSRPQADFVRDRDYSFVNGGKQISLNTLGKRAKVRFEIPECFSSYFDGTWTFGTAKLVSLNGNWFLHIPMTKTITSTLDDSKPKHVVGIDRGLRFLFTAYDETGKCSFYSGKDILTKHETFLNVRAELQSKGTKSAKRRLKSISGRENRWMTDVNHQLSKTLTREYGPETLYVLEDLAGVSFSEKTLSERNAKQRGELRSWTFYQFEQMLSYKALETGSKMIKVSPEYTSQRCPKCGRIHKENRKHETHEYVCDACGYRSNDDRIAAMNLYTLGTMYVSGDTYPRFGSRRVNKE